MSPKLRRTFFYQQTQYTTCQVWALQLLKCKLCINSGSLVESNVVYYNKNLFSVSLGGKIYYKKKGLRETWVKRKYKNQYTKNNITLKYFFQLTKYMWFLWQLNKIISSYLQRHFTSPPLINCSLTESE